MAGKITLVLLSALTATLIASTGASPVFTEGEKEQAANDQKSSDPVIAFVSDIVGSVASCDKVCPSKSMKCSQWKYCRAQNSDVCVGLVAMCHDHEKGHKSRGPLKAVLMVPNPAIEQYSDSSVSKEEVKNASHFMCYIVILFIIMGVFAMVLKSCAHLGRTRGENDEEKASPRQVIFLGGKGQSLEFQFKAPSVHTPEQLAAVDEIVKRINEKYEKKGKVFGQQL